ncbi:hypothetical protein ACFVW5_07565 [Streptomyces sp. NPDC058232]|uniref:hypothetical protein n=1 Tax=unclassified Streptomyces TaxID=2593676 RepID=UPI0036EE2CDB
MERAIVLSRLVASGTDTAAQRLTELAAELDIPAADLLVVAGHPVPAELLPPERDARVMRQFAYRVGRLRSRQQGRVESSSTMSSFVSMETTTEASNAALSL